MFWHEMDIVKQQKKERKMEKRGKLERKKSLR